MEIDFFIPSMVMKIVEHNTSMETTLENAVRVLSLLKDVRAGEEEFGWYLKSTAYATTSAVELVGSVKESPEALAKLTEAALSVDDSRLFDAVAAYVGWDAFVDMATTYFGLSAFFVYGASACLTSYLSLWLENDPATWADEHEMFLFDQHETEFWDLDWSESWRAGNRLAILYLLHFRGGVRKASLLQKCIQHNASEFYPSLVALGARFSVDDVYRIPDTVTLDDLKEILSDGLITAFKEGAKSDDWFYLVQLLIAKVKEDEEDKDNDDDAMEVDEN